MSAKESNSAATADSISIGLLHPLLRRQLKKSGVNFPDGHQIEPGLFALIGQIDRAYRQADADRQLLERSISISSEEMRGLYQQLQRQNLELDKEVALRTAASAAKSRFLANMSHEIRTPMSAILGVAELMKHETDPEEVRAHVGTILRNGKHLLTVVDEILDISKIEAGKMQIELIPTDLGGLLQEVLLLMSGKAHSKELPLLLDVPSTLPPFVLTDPTRLRQILLNLIGNSIKFTRQGSVTLRASYSPEETVELSVIDTGIGMDEATIGQLFKPFTQADESTARQYGGTGLGLTISLRLAEILGGSIHVISTPGKGTTFTLSMPAKSVHSDNTQPLPIQSLHAENVRLDGHTILVADDMPDNRMILSRYLVRAGATVIAVEDGRQAVDTAIDAERRGKPLSCILLDMQMPILDGYQAARELAALSYPRPVVAVTAHAMLGDRELCLSAGCHYFLTKPINSIELLSLLTTLLGTQIRRAG